LTRRVIPRTTPPIRPARQRSSGRRAQTTRHNPAQQADPDAQRRTQACLGRHPRLAVLAFSGVQVLWAIVALLVVALSCQGFSNGNTSVGALSRRSAHAGSAAALMGMAQFSLGASSGLLVGLLTDGTPRGMAALMMCGSLGAVIADRLRPRS
jgi:hypothetical protein